MSRNPLMHGVDLSHWNEVKSFEALAKSVDFVMLKFGGEEGAKGLLTRDNCFEGRYQKLKDLGVHVGCYFFISNKEEVLSDSPQAICEKFRDAISGYQFDMPIALDVEGYQAKYKGIATRYVDDWCDIMESYGYYVSIYGSEISTFQTLVYLDELEKHDKWIARYRTKEPELDCGMWQYTSTGAIPGVNGHVDKNYAYYDYPSIIKKKGLNKWTT